jgi:ureidoacrylate peracid hydrolase
MGDLHGSNRSVTIEARPVAITIDTDQTAVLVVDMQNDFGAKGGMLDLAGIDISPNQAVIEPTVRLLSAARQAGIPVVYLKMGYRPDLSDLGAAETPNRIRHPSVGMAVAAPDGRASRVLIRDTWSTDIVDELSPHASDIVLYKTRYSGFHGTELDAVLRSRDVTSLIVAGWTTSVCVESTIRDAFFRDYRCVLVEDCAAEPMGHGLSRSNHEASVLTIQVRFGWISTSAGVIRAFESRRR